MFVRDNFVVIGLASLFLIMLSSACSFQIVGFASATSPGQITGSIFADSNLNGIRDTRETGLTGWQIKLNGTLSNGTTISPITTTSSTNGTYTFFKLNPGTYTLIEVPISGWVHTSSPIFKSISIGSGTIVQKNFGNVQLGTIAAEPFNDTNGNGIQDSKETLLSGWSVILSGKLSNGTNFSTKIINSNPTATFSKLYPGTYTLTEANKNGYSHTTPSTLSNIIDSATGTNLSYNFGNFKLPLNLNVPTNVTLEASSPFGSAFRYTANATDSYDGFAFTPYNTKIHVALFTGNYLLSQSFFNTLLKYYDSNDFVISKNLGYFSNLPNQTKILTEPSLSNVTYYAGGVAQSSQYRPSYINYDIESWNFTPLTEQSNPTKSIMTAANITHDGGFLFSTSPTSAVLRNLYVNLDFTKIDMLVFQLTNLLNQGFITNFTQSYNMISNYSEFYNPKIANVPQIDLNMSANGVIQSLKTVQNGSVNSVALLWNPTISNTTLTQVLSYIKFGTTNGTKFNPYAISCNPPSESGSPFPLGITVVTCTATDNHGFNATKSFTVTVRDTTAPTILAPANLFVQQTGALTQISNLGSPIVHDLVNTYPKVTNNAPVNGFSPGTTKVTWTACDFSGNCANAVQQITVGQTTKITMNSISLARWGQTITLTGTLTNSTGAPVVGRTITFSGTGVTNFPSAVTNSVGSFIASGKAPNTVAPGWTYQAYFGGDSKFLTSSSPIYTFATLKHHTSLIVSSNSVIVSSPTTFVATLVDTDSGKTGVAGETISYNGTGVIGVASQITNSSGIAIGTGTAPSTVGSDWTYEAVFAGDLLYLNSNSAIHSYKTT